MELKYHNAIETMDIVFVDQVLLATIAIDVLEERWAKRQIVKSVAIALIVGTRLFYSLIVIS